MEQNETPKNRPITVQLPPAIYEALIKMAADQMRPPTNLIRKVLADHLRNHKYLGRDEPAGNDDWRINLPQ